MTPEGKVSRGRDLALVDPGCLNGMNGVLILGSIELWEQFNSANGAGCSNSEFKVFQMLEMPDIVIIGSVKFDSLLLVKAKSITDLPLEEWFLLVENISWGDLHLQNYLAIHTKQTDSLATDSSAPQQAETTNKASDVTQQQVVMSREKSANSSEKENRDPNASGRFKMGNVGKPASTFIDENTAKSTKKANATVVNLFKNFMASIHPEVIKNIETIPVGDLPNLLNEFFMVISKEDGEEYNASTLESYYQAMTRVILDLRKINIKLEPAFSELRKVLSRRQKLSCENGEIPGKHKSQAIAAPVLAECWVQGAFGTENPRALVATVLLHTQSSFGTRGKSELWNMNNADIVLGPERYLKKVFFSSSFPMILFEGAMACLNSCH